MNGMRLSRPLLCPLFLVLAVTASAQDDRSPFEAGKKLKDAGEYTEALAKFEQAVAAEPERKEARFELAWCLNELKRYKDALGHLEMLKTTWSTIPKVWFESGYALVELTRYDEGLKDLRHCLELDPRYPDIHLKIGNACYFKEDHRGAVESFKKHRDSRPVAITSSIFWHRWGFSCNALKEYAAAREHLLKARDLKPDYAFTHLELGFACSRLKQNPEAIGHYQKAIEIDPKSHVGYNGVAEVYRDNLKDHKAAVEWYGKSLALNPKERKANYGMGYCLNTQRKHAEAIPYLEQAIASEPTYTAAYVDLGYALHRAGRSKDARGKLEHALKLNPDNVNGRFYLVHVHLALGDRDAARRYADELRPLNATLADSAQKLLQEKR